MLCSGDRVLVAMSGGADSTGLAVVLHAMRSKLGCDLVAAHVHHGLRGADADADEAAAADVATRLELPFVRAAVRLGRGGNVEARARDQRYGALHALAAQAGCNRIATGHTLDDQAETFLLRLLRGAGADGLAGIQPVRADGVVRPLLDCGRERVAAEVAGQGFAVRDDAMNRDLRFTRARVRLELLPLMRRIDSAAGVLCARAADAMRAAAAAQQLWVDAAVAAASQGTALRRSAVVELHADLRPLLLRGWLRLVLPESSPTARMLAGIERVAEASGPGTAVDVTASHRVVREGAYLRVEAVSRGRRRDKGS